jgi:predicted amidophosphoribosyltransferase
MHNSLDPNRWNKTKVALLKLKNDFLHLVYPEMCLICAVELPNSKIHICHLCENSLRYTYYESYKEPSSLDKLFWGRVKVNATYSLLHFEKDTSTQEILHYIKYKNNIELAKEMGIRIGEKLLSNPEKFGSIDVLIPSPIHPKKRYLRGYNQSEIIANGISKSLNIPVNTEFLTKNVHTESQTKKGRFSRWDNVVDVFNLNPEKLKNAKHIALVDDVVTTGSTLEANILKIRQALPQIEITILCLASTK